MKSSTDFILIFLTALLPQLARAQALPDRPGPTGDLAAWAGHYEVTRCTQCPDHLVDVGANMKNLVTFDIGVDHLASAQLPDCASTDILVRFAFVITSDDRAVRSHLQQTAGLCDWGSYRTLEATPERFFYREGASGDTIFSLRRTGPNQFEVYKRQTRWKASFGYPEAYEYYVEARRVN